MLENQLDPEQTKEKKELSAQEIQEHIEEGGNLTWVKMEELLQDSPESCVDGRGQEGIIGTPGGNAGEFILALITAETISNKKIDIQQIEEILDRYLKKAGKFHTHTDDHVLKDLDLSHEEIIHPNPDDQTRLLDLLSNPDHVGCGHLKLMGKNPKEYNVRSEMVSAVIKAIYKKLWAGDDIEFVVLEGGHKEGAVVNIVTDDETITADTEIPTIKPSTGKTQMFINHPQATQFMREEIAQDITSIIGIELNVQDFNRKTKELGDQQLNATIGHLAKGLPVYNVHFVNKELDRVELVA